MKLPFEIVEYKGGNRATIYSIHIEGQEKNEADKFFEEFYDSHNKDITDILERLEHMIERSGFEDHQFKHIGTPNDATEEIKSCNIRMFVLKYSKVAIIIGGGGVKNKVRTYQEVPRLNKLAKMLMSISKMFDNKINESEISWTKTEPIRLEGNLKFNNND